MSYVLHVWELPQPGTLSEAVEVQARLAREARPPNPRLMRLAQQLTESFPDLDEDDDQPGVWTDGPLTCNAQAAVFAIGVQTHALDAVVPVIVQLAGQAGLVVLDDQAGRVFLPGGRVLGGPLAGAARVAASMPVSRADVLTALNGVLGPLLTGQGFEALPKGGGYRLQADSATFEVRFETERRAQGELVAVVTSVTLPGRLSHPLVEHHYPQGTDFLLDHARLAKGHGMAWPEMQDSPGAQSDITSHDALDRVAAHWGRVFESVVLPLVQRSLTLEGLAQELTGNMAAFSQRPVTLVLAATLDGLDLADVARRLSQWVPPHVARGLEGFAAGLQQSRRRA